MGSRGPGCPDMLQEEGKAKADCAALSMDGQQPSSSSPPCQLACAVLAPGIARPVVSFGFPANPQICLETFCSAHG